jgi:hypothetical protein
MRKGEADVWTADEEQLAERIRAELGPELAARVAGSPQMLTRYVRGYAEAEPRLQTTVGNLVPPTPHPTPPPPPRRALWA